MVPSVYPEIILVLSRGFHSDRLVQSDSFLFVFSFHPFQTWIPSVPDTILLSSGLKKNRTDDEIFLLGASA
jgi:hypothetical protein